MYVTLFSELPANGNYYIAVMTREKRRIQMHLDDYYDDHLRFIHFAYAERRIKQ